MAEGDVEFGHVVDLTLGEPSGTELVADAAIGATTLTVDYAGDFEDTGEVSLNGAVLPYTAITYGAAETDPDVITLAAPLAAAAVVDDKVVRMSGGEQVTDWLLHVSLGDGHPVDIPIPYEQRAMWSSVDPSTPVPVLVSADLERLVEVPGRTPVLDGSFIDPTSSIPGGQAFSLDAPTATDGYPEDYGWWQVDAAGKVLGFWRLVAGVWTPQTIVTAEALVADNAIIDALQGETITGTTVQTAALGKRVVLDGADVVPALKAYDATSTQTVNIDGESNYMVGEFATGLSGQRIVARVETGIGPIGVLRFVGGAEDIDDSAHIRSFEHGMQIMASIHPWGVPSQLLLSADEIVVGFGAPGADRVELKGTVVDITGTLGTGSVGTGTFRDSVRSAVMGNYAAGAWTAYTPTFTAATTNPTLGSFTRVGRYTQRGKTVTFTIVITATAGTGLGSGTYEFGLPVTARSADEIVVTGAQTGPNHSYVGRSSGGSTSVITLMLTSTDAAINATNSGMASGTVLRINGTYEAA